MKVRRYILMSQVDSPRGNAPKTKVELTLDVWKLAVGFIERRNERDPLGRVSLRALVNQAVKKYVTEDEQEASR
jgi:hypothetical protein